MTRTRTNGVLGGDDMSVRVSVDFFDSVIAGFTRWD